MSWRVPVPTNAAPGVWLHRQRLMAVIEVHQDSSQSQIWAASEASSGSGGGGGDPVAMC